ncbi:MAG TPA: hypothetical protein VHO68_05555 [Bacteroidales bacterium]|nr:hypothetical protein [Bacteroidales bacterium]
MQITALLQVIKYMKELAGNQAFMYMYKQLADLVKEASKSNDNDLSSKIVALKEEIISLQLTSDPSEWGYASYSLYEKMNSGRLFGRPAAEYLENLVDHGSMDYSSVYAELNRTVKQLGKFSDNISKLSTLFELILPMEEMADTDDCASRSTVLLYFEGQLVIQSISDLERYSRLWDNILGSFCSLAGEDKPAVDICNFSKGNIVLGVSAGEATLKALIKGVDGMIQCMQDLLKIRKIELELSGLSLHYDLNELLEEESELLVGNTSVSVAGNLIEEAGKVSDYELLAMVTRSLKQILSFIEKGGKLEYRPVKSSTADDKIRRSLNESFRAAREISEIRKSLETTKMQNNHQVNL